MNIEQYMDTWNWNKSRGYNKLDPKLELDMLQEEKIEFYEAHAIIEELDAADENFEDKHIDALTDMVDAYLDYSFVAAGTKYKTSVNAVEMHNLKEVEAILSLASIEIGNMEAILSYFVGNSIDVSACYQFVLDANELKPAKTDVNGKGIKGDKWVDPKIHIKEYLISALSHEQADRQSK